MSFIFQNIEEVEQSGKYKYLSSGGEGRVYEIVSNPKQVYKIYTYHSKSVLRNKRLERFRELAKVLPENVIVPIEVIKKEGEIVGYTMKNLTNTEELRHMILKDQKTLQEKLQIIIRMGETLEKIQEHDVIIGDFSTNNILVDKNTNEVYFIDTDCWGIEDEIDVAPVTRSKYTDPRCYRFMKTYAPELVTKESNWYTFALISLEIILGEYPDHMILDELEFEAKNMSQNLINIYKEILLKYKDIEILSLLKNELKGMMEKKIID